MMRWIPGNSSSKSVSSLLITGEVLLFAIPPITRDYGDPRSPDFKALPPCSFVPFVVKGFRFPDDGDVGDDVRSRGLQSSLLAILAFLAIAHVTFASPNIRNFPFLVHSVASK
jgi:hypothetical protein